LIGALVFGALAIYRSIILMHQGGFWCGGEPTKSSG
jgi:hypothetical protein